MVRGEYALAGNGKDQSGKASGGESEKPQVSPDVFEVLHMLDALQTKKNGTKSDH